MKYLIESKSEPQLKEFCKKYNFIRQAAFMCKSECCAAVSQNTDRVTVNIYYSEMYSCVEFFPKCLFGRFTVLNKNIQTMIYLKLGCSIILELIIRYHRGTDGERGHNWFAVCIDLSMKPLSYHIPISDRFWSMKI